MAGHRLVLYWKPAHNTRFILFGHSASAFAKAVAPAKENYLCFANV